MQTFNLVTLKMKISQARKITARKITAANKENKKPQGIARGVWQGGVREDYCGEAGTRHASVRNISETALMFEAKEKLAEHSIISAGLYIPGRESPLQILGRGYRIEKINHSDSYNTVMVYQLLDKPTRKVIKSYIYNCIRKTNPKRSIIQKVKDLVR